MFRFKQFYVNDDQSSMKVGTDAVLLAAWAALPREGRILDVGTGCGVIALICAQRSRSEVTGIDIHTPSVEEALRNFSLSPWASRMKGVSVSLQAFSLTRHFDYIISNPPYFRNSLRVAEPSRNDARHCDRLSYQELLAHARRLINPGGILGIILPFAEKDSVVSQARDSGWEPMRMLYVFSKPGPVALRIAIEFSVSGRSFEPEMLCICNENGEFSEEYRKLTGDFYLNF